MKRLKEYSHYNFIKTPIVCLEKYSSNKNLYAKLEGNNLNGSIKSRTAYFIFKDIMDKRNVKNIVESSSGNLGLSLGYFANELGYNFLCLVDQTVPEQKIKQLRDANIRYEMVSLGNFPDFRSARIAYAQALDSHADWFWTNQYGNMANEQAHYITTGPELVEQFNGQIDFFVCAVGSGGTISGTGRYLKENLDCTIVAVEPKGSTIFGGEPSKYLTAGLGLSYPSKVLMKNIFLIDYYVKVEDSLSIQACMDVKKMEGLSVGITTGSVLYAAHCLAEQYPTKNIVCISPDGGQLYQDIFDNYKIDDCEHEFKLLPVRKIIK